MMASWRTYCQRAQREKLPTGFAYKMTTAMGNLVLFQHQDGVTGTAKYHVIWDYGTRMHNCLQGLQIFMSKAIEVLLGIRHDKSDRNPSQFESEQVRSKYDVQPVFKAINSREGTSQYVEFSNPLEQSREEIAMLIVNMPDVTILDSNWTCVRSQASSEQQQDKSKTFTGRHSVLWKASVPAMGLQTYYVANGFERCDKAKPARLEYFSMSNVSSCPAPYDCSRIEGGVDEIQNQHQTLNFDIKHGLLRKITQNDGWLEIRLDCRL
jgi:alpha-mannosidase II